MSEKEITFDECEYSTKYDRMGVTPRELYYRQQRMCKLQFAYDEYEGEKTPGGLYCTDGTEFALFGSMLNPTFECIQCVNRFIMGEAHNNMLYNKLDKFIVSMLMSISEAKTTTGEQPLFYMSKRTYDSVTEHISSNIMASEESNPVKQNEDGDTTLFGCVVVFNSLDDGHIELEPGGIALRVPNEKKV